MDELINDEGHDIWFILPTWLTDHVARAIEQQIARRGYRNREGSRVKCFFKGYQVDDATGIKEPATSDVDAMLSEFRRGKAVRYVFGIAESNDKETPIHDLSVRGSDAKSGAALGRKLFEIFETELSAGTFRWIQKR